MSQPATILLVDDEVAFCQMASLWLAQSNYHVHCVHDAIAAQAYFQTHKVDLVIQDLAMPPEYSPEAGLALLKHYGHVPVIVITGHADRDLALLAMKLGAYDFISKPLDPALFAVVVARAIEKGRLEKALRQQPSIRNDVQLIGVSDSVNQCRELISRIAPTDVPVLIIGPSGTGKEVIAKAIHQQSQRREQPLVAVHCGAIPADLLEAELFGYKKGAFTGANEDRIGLIQAADGGTLFLDEIGDMPHAMQVKLLRALQERQFYPVGGREQVSVNIRLLSATNKDLAAAISDGSFREDLFYRIKGLQIHTSPLSERRVDIAPLVHFCLQQYNQQQHSQKTLTEAALSWCLNQPWPGNVRELANAVNALCAVNISGAIDDSDIALLFAQPAQTTTVSANSATTTDDALNLEWQVQQLEIRLISRALSEANGNKSQAAQRLGLSRQGLLNKLERYGLNQ